MRHLRRTVLAALTVALGVASAQALRRRGGRLVVPTRRFDGLTGPEVQAEGWYRVHTLPVPENPFDGNGEGCVRLGRHGKVLLAYGLEPPCTVKRGTAVWIMGVTGFCNNVLEPYFADEASQRRCAFESFQGPEQVERIRVTIDGGQEVDIHRRRYEFYTRQREGQLPVGNTFGVPPQRFTFTAYGWGAWLRGLPIGQHDLRSVAVFANGNEHVWEVVVNVVR